MRWIEFLVSKCLICHQNNQIAPTLILWPYLRFERCFQILMFGHNENTISREKIRLEKQSNHDVDIYSWELPCFNTLCYFQRFFFCCRPNTLWNGRLFPWILHFSNSKLSKVHAFFITKAKSKVIFCLFLFSKKKNKNFFSKKVRCLSGIKKIHLFTIYWRQSIEY